MKLLDVSPRVTWPLTSGGRVRVYNLLSRLAGTHEIRQFSQTSLRDVRRPGFETEVELAPHYVEHRHRHWIGTALNEMMERSGFGMAALSGHTLALSRPRILAEWVDWADVIVVEFPWQHAYCRSLAGGKPVVLATHNVQIEKSESARSMLTAGWRAWIAAIERRAVRTADLILAVSERDREGFVRRHGADPERIVVVPNGVDTVRFVPVSQAERTLLKQRLNLPRDRPLIIFPAPHSQSPIVAAMAWVRRVADLMPECTFLVTGAIEGNRPRSERNLLFTGFVAKYPDYLRASDCFFCPIQLGGGTKLKLIEAAAAGMPIVALVESIRGTAFQPDVHVTVTEARAEAMTSGIRAVLADPDGSHRMGLAAARHARAAHDWDDIAAIMHAALSDLAAGRVGRSGGVSLAPTA